MSKGKSATRAPRKEVKFGSLILAFTSQYHRLWWDKGSGAKSDVGFWHPIPPNGFHALGSTCISNYSDPNGDVGALCVKASSDTIPGTQKPALKRPTGYEFIWNDAGSKADEDGSCWRPIPPAGYVALGDVFAKGWKEPGLDAIMCVAKELASEGVVGRTLWTDRGSGASRDFGAWQIETIPKLSESSHGLFAVNSFTGRESHSQPSTSPVAYTLRLPVPVEESGEPSTPELKSKTRPPDHTPHVVDRVVTVPFTAVVDPDKTTDWRLQNSPFYRIERAVFYDLLIFDVNNTSTEQVKGRTVTAGISREQSETFSINTGVSVGYEGGVEAGGFSSTVTLQLSIELGYSTTRTVSVFQSEEQSAQLNTPPKTAAALWTAGNSLRVVRDDGTPVARSLEFGEANTAYFAAQYPPPSENGQGANYRRTRTKL